jgi:hypothetical protein
VKLQPKGEWPVGEVYGVALLLFKHRMDPETKLSDYRHPIDIKQDMENMNALQPSLNSDYT